MNNEQHFYMQIFSTENTEYVYKSQFIPLSLKSLYLVADEGCLILFVDSLQIVKKTQNAVRVINNITNNSNWKQVALDSDNIMIEYKVHFIKSSSHW